MVMLILLDFGIGLVGALGAYENLYFMDELCIKNLEPVCHGNISFA